MTLSVNYQRGPKNGTSTSPAHGTAAGQLRPCLRAPKAQIFTELGPRNSTRFSDYQRLDFRASRTASAFSFFVELFNLLGHENVTRVNTFTFQQDTDGTGLAGHG